MPTAQSIRPAVGPDADAVAVLVACAYSKWIAVIGRPSKPMTADYQRAVVEHLVFVIDGDRPGLLAGVIELVPASDHMLIENVAVDPARQGEGLGVALLAFAETAARERGLAEMRLYTNALMQANVDLYERFGYAVTERRRIERLDTTVVYMSKRLA